MNHDAGYIKTGAQIGDFVWEDLDGDGVQDAGEPGISGVSVALNGTTGNGTAINLTTTTDAAGLYLFNNLIPGDYTVTFTTPAGYTITYQNQGADDNIDSDISQTTGATATINVTSGQVQLIHDAGYIKNGVANRRLCLGGHGRRRRAGRRRAGHRGHHRDPDGHDGQRDGGDAINNDIGDGRLFVQQPRSPEIMWSRSRPPRATRSRTKTRARTTISTRTFRKATGHNGQSINVDFWPNPVEPRRGLHQNGVHKLETLCSTTWTATAFRTPANRGFPGVIR